MPADTPEFLGRGWAFPPSFAAGGVRMTEDEADIEASLRILFGTRPGERPLQPEYGLDLGELLFESLTTTLRNLVADRIKAVVAVQEARINLLDLVLDDSQALEGLLAIRLDYVVRSTNSRFNLVFPYYLGDANEVRAAVAHP